MREPLHGDPCERAIAGIADGDQHIAQKAHMPDALDRPAGETLAKRRLVESGEFAKRRRLKILARDQLGLARCLSELVPRADREAIVAAEYPGADRLAKLRVDVP